MKIEDCYQLGYITKTYGKKGEVVLLLEVDYPGEYEGMESVLIAVSENREELVPFFIENISVSENKAYIRFEDLYSPEEARELVNKKVYLPLGNLPEPEEGQFYFHELIGFRLEDQKAGTLGKVQNIFNLPGQDVISMEYKGKEVLVPITEDTVLNIDRKAQIVYTNLPEGLLDVYLS